MFKKAICSLFFVGLLYATDSNIVEIMQDLQYDSNMIDNGFASNKFDLVKKGIQKHKNDFDQFRKFNINIFLTQQKLNYAPIVDSFISNIVEQRILLEEFLAKDDKIRAFEAYQQMRLNCMKCHSLIRGW
ncbi:hypothetical protein [uncultured Helicobacter sp.]|uniref:hypothetical protein n=1 Tax=uncultured Helicobacter sp. TaxID=175537 RepID=UPI0027DD3E24|nr:hypothetical protein [uncultured Helicobacter sp.]